ncbi:MAG TPA: sulfur carrier protein ThiS [Burkholderiaceae bacterium]|nr:sulfur carrier protein ThiS [Burkholderiaceae bacterium]
MNEPVNAITMNLRVDDKPYDVPVAITLADLVTRLGHAAEGVTTAVNGVFVPRGQRATHVLQADDAVLIFKPVGGG